MAAWEENAEWFPMSWDCYKRMVAAAKHQATRDFRTRNLANARRGLAYSRPPIPEPIWKKIQWDSNGEGTQWYSGEPRDLWWREVIYGMRYEKWVPHLEREYEGVIYRGPAMLIGGLITGRTSVA